MRSFELVNNVARLTQTLRDGVARSVSEQQSRAHRAGFAEKRSLVHEELQQKGEAIFTDEHGKRFLITRKRP